MLKENHKKQKKLFKQSIDLSLIEGIDFPFFYYPIPCISFGPNHFCRPTGKSSRSYGTYVRQLFHSRLHHARPSQFALNAKFRRKTLIKQFIHQKRKFSFTIWCITQIRTRQSRAMQSVMCLCDTNKKLLIHEEHTQTQVFFSE